MCPMSMIFMFIYIIYGTFYCSKYVLAIPVISFKLQMVCFMGERSYLFVPYVIWFTITNQYISLFLYFLGTGKSSHCILSSVTWVYGLCTWFYLIEFWIQYLSLNVSICMWYTHSHLLQLDLVWTFLVDRDTKLIYPT